MQCKLILAKFVNQITGYLEIGENIGYFKYGQPDGKAVHKVIY